MTATGLHVAVLELPARWNDRDGVLRDVARLLGSGPAPHLVVLPEASITGYVSPDLDFDLSAFAEPLDGATAMALSSMARAHGCHLAGPVIERQGARCYNALSVFGPDGERVAHYRKRHPWYPEAWATAGDGPPPIFEVHGVRITCAICFDVHFLEADAARELGAADVLLLPTAWVDEGQDARAELLPAIARRWDVAVVNANWGPGVPSVEGQGGSLVVARDGRVMARAARPGRIDARVG